ncbi:hypothetical protein MBAV_001779 [Candidatus Magnetobacterium bavaricum]|uniref:Uncharacterized protein n=1 Tax=Candidatus Magnetobacterium bavaricum TaxID=29290 RepID=A0A0F3GVU5_9BACT|nr:hypothetical protein MBAV_001779 [Candidatus Magnetobacterium bavaricum]
MFCTIPSINSLFLDIIVLTSTGVSSKLFSYIFISGELYNPPPLDSATRCPL